MGDLPLQVDWSQLLAELRTKPLSFQQLADATGLGKATIVELSTGCHFQPRHATGELLIAYWIQVTGKPREQLPMTPIR